jgi:two-component system sensor histidine kinase CreC
VIRLVIVAAASVGLILFLAFFVSRLLRTRTRGMSIRMQVFLALAVIVGAFAFGLGLLVVDRVEARAARLAMEAARDESTTIASILQSEMERTGAPLAELAGQLEARHLSLSLELLDADGRVLFPAGPSRAEEPGAVFVDAPLVQQGRQVGRVRVVKPTIVVEALLADFAPTVLVISLVLGAAAALAAAWIGRAIAAPIEALSLFSERVSEGERTRLPTAVNGREVNRLVRSIDSMRRQLEGRPFVEAFAADLSHELKNPVAAIRASAELLEEGALDEPAEAARFVRRIREAAERIERLLRDLLSLARIEARGTDVLDPIDLAQLLERCLEAVAEPRVQWSGAGPVRVRADALWLGRAVTNLLENAITHSPGDSAIAVELRAERDHAVVEVTNQGEIPKRVQERLFRRFVTTRADKGGSGLGLAIVRAVAEAHGGQVELAQPGPPQVSLRLTLPLVSPHDKRRP